MRRRLRMQPSFSNAPPNGHAYLDLSVIPLRLARCLRSVATSLATLRKRRAGACKALAARRKKHKGWKREAVPRHRERTRGSTIARATASACKPHLGDHRTKHLTSVMQNYSRSCPLVVPATHVNRLPARMNCSLAGNAPATQCHGCITVTT